MTASKGATSAKRTVAGSKTPVGRVSTKGSVVQTKRTVPGSAKRVRNTGVQKNGPQGRTGNNTNNAGTRQRRQVTKVNYPSLEEAIALDNDHMTGYAPAPYEPIISPAELRANDHNDLYVGMGLAVLLLAIGFAIARVF